MDIVVHGLEDKNWIFSEQKIRAHFTYQLPGDIRSSNYPCGDIKLDRQSETATKKLQSTNY